MLDYHEELVKKNITYLQKMEEHKILDTKAITVQSTRAIEYTNCIPVEGYDSPNEYPRYDIKQPDGKAPVMLKLWEKQSTPSLPVLPGPLWPRMIALHRILCMGQIEWFDI